MNTKIQRLVEQSPIWAQLNATAKEKVAECGVELSEEAYQRLRDLLVLKTMIEDKEVFQAVSDDIWEALQEQEASAM